MKNLILILIIILCCMSQAMAQNPLIDRSGTATFFSEAPMEDIEAMNKGVFGAVDLEKGTMAVSMLIKDFHFDKSLMEEHFNENYLESEKYPKSTFKGVINNYSKSDFMKSGSLEVEVEGEIEIHGVKKPLKTIVKFYISPSKIAASTSFQISVADFGVKVPTLVIKNIAEVVDVTATFDFIREK